MTTIEYFKLQAKNLHKDFKTQRTVFDPSLGRNIYEYSPVFFDVDAVVTDFDIDEEHFTLMNAQHIIAKLVGFEKWTEIHNATPVALELAKLLFENMHKINNEEWQYYILGIENKNSTILDDETKLDIFKTVYADQDGHHTYGYDYRLGKSKKLSTELQKTIPNNRKSSIAITTLPLQGKDRKEFIEAANTKFEDILQNIEPTHPELIRNLWNPELYLDEVLTTDMLPIDRNYAVSLVESFLIHKVIDLASETDN